MPKAIKDPSVTSKSTRKQPDNTKQTYTSLLEANQESSSQSSSADPHTPSPQYTQPVPIVHQEQSTIDTDSIDPHFARLLSSLTLSGATAAVKSQSLDKAAPTSISIQPNPQASSTPVPSLASLAHTLPEPVQIEHRREPLPSPNTTPSDPSSARPLPESISPSPPLISSHSAASAADVQSNSSVAAPLQSAQSPSSKFTISPRASRRTSSTADISPYLSRPPPEMPTSAKRLQQLALLESVADESARMSPFLRNAVPQYPVPPLPPASVPPPSHDLNNTRLLYSSGPAPGLPAHDPWHPMPLPDLFQARPRTSNTIQRPIYHGPGSMSMNQSQLLALMNAPRPGPGPVHPPAHASHAFPHPRSQMYAPPPYISAPPFGRPMQMGQGPPQMYHPGPLAHPMQPVPLSAPAMSPGFNVPHYGHNANGVMNNHLLSILNGTTTGPSAAA